MASQSLNLPRALSFSSISLYAECPQKYKFRYIDRIPEKPKHYFSFGSSVHLALEYFYGVKTPPPPSLLEVLAYYKEHWIKAGYKDQAQEAQYFKEGEGILTLFYEKHIPDYQVPLFVEYHFNMEIDGVPVTGKVDRVDRMPDGRFSVVDYKTGKALANNRVSTDEQLTMYQLACEKLLGAEVCRLSFYHLPSLSEQVSLRHPPEQVKALERKIVSTAESISRAQFAPAPSEKKCFWCDYKPLCPVYKPQDAAAAAAPPMDILSPVDPASSDDELAALVDRYGELHDRRQALEREAQDLKAEIVMRFAQKGYVRAFGRKFEAARSAGEKWEFPDKKKFLDFLRANGLYDRVLAPSATKIRALLEDPGLPIELREQLLSLTEKTETSELKVRPI